MVTTISGAISAGSRMAHKSPFPTEAPWPFPGSIAAHSIFYMPQRSAAVWTGASHQPVISSSSMVSVIEQPAMSSEVT